MDEEESERTGLRDGVWACWAVRVEGKRASWAGPEQDKRKGAGWVGRLAGWA